MNFQFRKFYDAGANENVGGADVTNEGTDTAIAEKEGSENTEIQDATPPAQQVPKQIISDEELKTWNFDSPEALKSFVKQKLEQQKESSISEEEKKANADIEKATFLKFSAENKLLNVDEYNSYENIKSISDKDLVFKNFKEEYKLDHPEITDEKELEEAAQEDFDYEYKLKSESESAKKKGEAKLAKEAKELRSPFESKVTTAQEQFNTDKTLRAAYPKFESFVQDLIVKNTPDKTVLFKAKDGDNEVPIEIELTAKDREAMAKDFKTPKSFQKFIDGKPEEVEAALNKKMQNWVKLNKFDEVNLKTFETGKGIGTANGSNVGAENSYPFRKGGISQEVGEETLEQSNARIAKLRQQNQY